MDCSPVMLAEARRIVPGSSFTLGDVCALRHEDGAFDAVTTVYTLRNSPDLERGVREMYRVTKPGGVVVILDAFPAQNALMRGGGTRRPHTPDTTTLAVSPASIHTPRPVIG